MVISKLGHICNGRIIFAITFYRLESIDYDSVKRGSANSLNINEKNREVK